MGEVFIICMLCDTTAQVAHYHLQDENYVTMFQYYIFYLDISNSYLDYKYAFAMLHLLLRNCNLSG